MPPKVVGVTCTVSVVRDSHGAPRDLVIVGAEAPTADAAGVTEIVGRSLREMLPGAADDLLERLDSANGAPVELRVGADSPDRGHSLLAQPISEPDVWTVTVDPVAEESVGDARLRELNHRVLNSLAMLSSIIGIESRALGDDVGRAALERVRSRLVAVSNLYRILSAADSGTIIRADVYLRSVADAVRASVGLDDRVSLDVDAAACELTTSQAASLGLITNEAMTNAYKHAFGGRGSGRIVVRLSEGPTRLALTVSDDGMGMSAEARSGLGTTLIEALAVDLSGEVEVQSGDWGTSVQVRFPPAS